MYTIPAPEELKIYRLKVGLTQAALAEKAGVSQSLIARIETGSVDPRASTLKKILNVLRYEEKGGKLTAEKLMRTPVISVRSNSKVGRASKIMEERDISQLPVIEKGIQIGSISETHVVKEMTSGKDLSELSMMEVKGIMDDAFPTVDRHTGIETITNLVELNPAVLVVDKGKVIGIITKTDVIRLVRR